MPWRKWLARAVAAAAMLAIIVPGTVAAFRPPERGTKTMQTDSGKEEPIVTQSANIAKERLDRGRVCKAAIGGVIRIGNITTVVDSQLDHGNTGYSINLKVDAPARHVDFGGEYSVVNLGVGDTWSSRQMGVSVTVVSFDDWDGVQSVSVLFEPYQPDPPVEQSVQPPAGAGTTATAALGDTVNLDGHAIALPYALDHDRKGYYLTLPMNEDDDKGMTLRLGQTKTASDGLCITLTALTAINGRQGVVLVASPKP
ncbi:hypothetical protein PT279_04485 [Bifidobacterium sp. ESL0784]|uniref:hypothetical protein n=1 Tax=Bifidobacterium sp. ESL0784 TaxID=2983231 RepID=UPI0023F87D85|nr:hypothetical protein [Bifidobacterium sp. ESL0784]MDF7640845.1 hypothetical protein [Bifidobacterium sp. ESL0784]